MVSNKPDNRAVNAWIPGGVEEPMCCADVGGGGELTRILEIW